MDHRLISVTVTFPEVVVIWNDKFVPTGLDDFESTMLRALEHRSSVASQFPSKKTPSKPPMVATRISMSFFLLGGISVGPVFPFFLVVFVVMSCVSYLFVVMGNGWDELVEELGARKRGVFFFLFFFFSGDSGCS